MKRNILLFFTALLSPFFLFAQENTETTKGLDEKINEFVQPATDFISGIVFYSVNLGEADTSAMPLVIILLLTVATIFTLYFGFINIRGINLTDWLCGSCLDSRKLFL